MKIVSEPVWTGVRLQCACGTVFDLEADDEPFDRFERHGDRAFMRVLFHCPACRSVHGIDIDGGKIIDANND